ATLGSGGGSANRGQRVVASFDEDSTTMGVAAARAALSVLPSAGAGAPADLYFATTSPAYLDKTNAAAIHAALGLGSRGFAGDLAGSARSGVAALRSAAALGGIAVLADVRTGQPGSADERGGGDAAAAFVFGYGDDGDGGIADIIGQASRTAEVLDRWRLPARAAADVWEERFGYEQYAPLIREAAAAALADAQLEQADHVVLVSPNSAVPRRGKSLVTGAVSTTFSPMGHAGVADAGVALAAVLDHAEPGQTILVLSAADGCDALVLRTTGELANRRQPVAVEAQLKAGTHVPYASYLTWRGWLQREPPRRPEPDRPAAPPSARAGDWKFSFTGSACTACGFVHLPPARVCHQCGAVDQMTPVRRAGTVGTVATFTVDRLAYSPAPPLVDAVINFDGGGRYALEVADADPDQLAVGSRVELVFRRLFTAGGVHNYFWKAKVI
ncbi:MAG TPA: OB-fold domain-containing protein, partial [Streptosporangiaceae bacterium]|nr:OB-fold domain-containing protein [Streptosporangiaceae bacterium]